MMKIYAQGTVWLSELVEAYDAALAACGPYLYARSDRTETLLETFGESADEQRTLPTTALVPFLVRVLATETLDVCEAPAWVGLSDLRATEVAEDGVYLSHAGLEVRRAVDITALVGECGGAGAGRSTLAADVKITVLLQQTVVGADASVRASLAAGDTSALVDLGGPAEVFVDGLMPLFSSAWRWALGRRTAQEVEL